MPSISKVATEFHGKVATRCHQSSHPLGAADLGATQGVVLRLGLWRFVRGGWDGTGKAADEEDQEGTCVSFRRGPQRPRDRDALRSCAALGGAGPGAVRGFGAELVRGPRHGRRGAGGGALSGSAGSAGRRCGLGEGREGPVRPPRRDAEVAVGGMARDAPRWHELCDLVPPVPGMAAAPGRDDAPEPSSRRAGCSSITPE